MTHGERTGSREGKKRGIVLLTAASLSHVAMREREPDWEVMAEDEPLWSSSVKHRSDVGVLFDRSEEGKDGPNRREGSSANDVDARESSGVSERWTWMPTESCG